MQNTIIVKWILKQRFRFRKIISKEKTEIDKDKNEEVNVDPQTSTTDFDDLASQLA